MKCPDCNSEDVRRSRRRGPKEGTALRLKGEAPYRCRQCGSRFAAKSEETDQSSAPHQVSFADYLGLTGWARRAFSDHAVIGGLLAIVFLVMLGLFFAFALGWLDPLVLHLKHD